MRTVPYLTRPVVDERDGLLAWLAQQRYAVRLAAYGLSDEQARATPSASGLSIGGIVKHLAIGESGWVDTLCGLPAGPRIDVATSFRMGADEHLADLLDRYAAVAARTEELVGTIDDMGRAVPAPRGWWVPDDVEAWSARWVLQHLISEAARHAGHADVVRESLDGATTLSLMAAAEGWPASRWVQPWQPAGGGTPAQP